MPIVTFNAVGQWYNADGSYATGNITLTPVQGLNADSGSEIIGAPIVVALDATGSINQPLAVISGGYNVLMSFNGINEQPPPPVISGSIPSGAASGSVNLNQITAPVITIVNASNHQGTYNPTQIYQPGQMVYYQGSTFVCVAPCVGVAPGISPTVPQWQILALGQYRIFYTGSAWPARPSASVVPAGFATYISTTANVAAPTDSLSGDLIFIPTS